MKKKIKDLTIEDLLSICLKYSCEPCDDCPLSNIVCDKYFNIDNLYDVKLNQEIEVDINEEKNNKTNQKTN